MIQASMYTKIIIDRFPASAAECS